MFVFSINYDQTRHLFSVKCKVITIYLVEGGEVGDEALVVRARVARNILHVQQARDAELVGGHLKGEASLVLVF